MQWLGSGITTATYRTSTYWIYQDRRIREMREGTYDLLLKQGYKNSHVMHTYVPNKGTSRPLKRDSLKFSTSFIIFLTLFTLCPTIYFYFYFSLFNLIRIETLRLILFLELCFLMIAASSKTNYIPFYSFLLWACFTRVEEMIFFHLSMSSLCILLSCKICSRFEALREFLIIFSGQKVFCLQISYNHICSWGS